ncbi:NUDIX hydrolase [Specibacter sp. RAF43]|uniref:NUDIX hydrolase n=1 Tax=Specibacter sp. RAF43 TaxID=3233057 RepID=UPI003F951B8E
MGIDEPLAPLEDACTVVLLRDGPGGLEVLLLERPGASSAFGGAWVFPGGKVDPVDRLDPDGHQLSEVAAARIAGLREVAEETGQQLEPETLVPLSQWTPMQRIPRRFRTWFFIAAATTAEVILNPGEHENYAWLAPAEALRRHAVGAMALVPPTWVTLHHLREFGTAARALGQAAACPPFVYDSYLLMPDAGTPASGAPAGVVWAGDEAYPGGGGAAGERAGARHRLDMAGLPWVFERTDPPSGPMKDSRMCRGAID